MIDPGSDGTAGGSATPVSVGVLAGGIVYSTSFSATLVQGWETAASAFWSGVGGSVAAIVVGFAASGVQAVVSERHSYGSYALREGIPRIGEVLRFSAATDLKALVSYGNGGAAAIPPIPDSIQVQVLRTLDRRIDGAAREVEIRRRTLVEAEARLHGEIRKALSSSARAVSSTLEKNLASFEWALSQLADAKLRDALARKLGDSVDQPDVRMMARDGMGTIAALEISGREVTNGDTGDVKSLLCAYQATDADAQGAADFLDAFRPWKQAVNALALEIEKVKAQNRPRTNTLWRRRRLKKETSLRSQ